MVYNPYEVAMGAVVLCDEGECRGDVRVRRSLTSFEVPTPMAMPRYIERCWETFPFLTFSTYNTKQIGNGSEH